MIPSRHAGAVRAPSTHAEPAVLPDPARFPVAATVVVPIARARRYRGGLRRLAEPASAALRERIVRELRGSSSR